MPWWGYVAVAVTLAVVGLIGLILAGMSIVTQWGDVWDDDVL